MVYDYRRLIDNIYDGLYFVDLKRRITFWNKGAERITGYRAQDVVGSRCADKILMHVNAEGVSLCKGLCPLAQTMVDGQPRQAEVFLHHKQGHRLPIWVRVMPLEDETGQIIGGVELFTDISHQATTRARIEELEQLAMLDTLTQMPNRRNMEGQLETCFHELHRFQIRFGLLFIDIDHFKQVNDNYGHAAGDRVLQVVAQTLMSAVRPFDIFGRWGGEEFIGLVRNINLPQLVEIGNRMRLLIARSAAEIDHQTLTVTASMGATQVRTDDTVGSLIQRADSLMYRSKQTGRNRLTSDLDIS